MRNNIGASTGLDLLRDGIDISLGMEFNFTAGSDDLLAHFATWGGQRSHETLMAKANATSLKLVGLSAGGEWIWASVVLLGLIVMLVIAWMVHSLPLPHQDFARSKKYDLPPFCCSCTRRWRRRAPMPVRLSLDDLLNTAEKVLDACKLVSVLFIFLTPSAIAQHLCDTPSVLLTLPGYDLVTVAPSFASGVKIDPSRYIDFLHYTTEQYHALMAIYSVTVDMRFFFGIFVLEVAALTLFVGSWGAVRKERWAPFYATIALFLAIVWAVYESQMYTLMRLLDNDESFLCVVPFLSVYTRAFFFLHYNIATFYYGLALGWSALLTRCLGPPGGGPSPTVSSSEMVAKSQADPIEPVQDLSAP